MGRPKSRSCGTNSGYAGGCRCVSCKAAHASYFREYLSREGKRENERVKRQNVRQRIASIKLAAGCVDCGYNANDLALDFDHLEGFEKRFDISRGLGRPWVKIEAEMAKCEIVCANCHRIRTNGRGSYHAYVQNADNTCADFQQLELDSWD